MKKLVTILCALAMFTQGFGAVAADDSATPKLDEMIEKQLIESGRDKDGDGKLSAEELSAIHAEYLDLTGVTDLSFLKALPHLQSLTLEGGSISDLAVLTNYPQIMSLTLRDMTLDDLSFLHNMCLDYCMLENVESRSAFDRKDLLRLQDYTFEQGYAETIEIRPNGLFEDDSYEIIIDDHSLIFEDDEFGSMSGRQELYTLAEGETAYHVLLDGEEIYCGTITVEPQNLKHEPIANHVISWADYTYPTGMGDVVETKVGSRLFHIDGTNGEVTLLREGVSALQSVFLDTLSGISSFHFAPMELHKDGTLFVDGEQILPEENFVRIRENCAMTDDQKLYGIYRQDDKNISIKIADNCAEILATEEFPIYLTTEGKVCLYTVSSSKTAVCRVTDMAMPKKYFYYDILDENGFVWTYERGVLKKLAEKAADIGIFLTKEEGSRSCYLGTDGNAYLMDGKGMVTLLEEPTCDLKNALHGSFFFGDWYESGEKTEGECGGSWRLSADGILTISYLDQRFAIDNSANVVAEAYDASDQRHYVYFARQDASLWRYCIETDSAEMFIEGESPSEAGDLNHDGTVSIADAVVLQKWLTGQKTTAFTLQEADENGDGVINISDLTLLKRTLMHS